MTTVGDVIGWMNQWYPADRAEPWDSVGLIAGSTQDKAQRILLAVDPVWEVAQQAIEDRADMIITHHPLFLRGTETVSSDEPKGKLVTELIRNNIALFNAHTNADMMHDGVAQALGDLLGVGDLRPIAPADPVTVGHGRIGSLAEAMTLLQFAELVAARLPKGPNGLLVGGDLERMVSSVAVSGGAGDSFLSAATQLGADVFVTADLRHHPASEHLEDVGAPALISASHWATEWPWLPVLAQKLEQEAQADDSRIEVMVSRLVTEPWVVHLATKGSTL